MLVKIIIILLLFATTSFGQVKQPEFKFDLEKYGVDLGIATGLNLAHGLIDYGANPYRTKTLQRITQTTIDIIFAGVCYLVTGSWSASLMYAEMRWCGVADEFYYQLHGLDGNSKYGNDFNPVAEHLNFTPIGLIRGGVTKQEHYINLSLSIPFSFATEYFAQKFNF